jgi:hypothetical protein
MEILKICLLCLIVVPLTVYFSVKLGTYAYLRARFLFLETHTKEKESDEQD